MPTRSCPTCGETVLVTRAHAGRVMRCPGCSSPVDVPGAAEGDRPATADQPEHEIEVRAAADEIARAVGDRPRGVPRPQPPARAVARQVFVVFGVLALVVLALSFLLLSVLFS